MLSKLKSAKWNHYANYIVVAALTVIFAILSLTGFLESSDKYLLEKIAISITLAVSLSMVVGFLGELSLGHAGFMCIGAYLGGKTAVILEPMLGEWPALLVSLAVGGVVAAAAFSTLFGYLLGGQLLVWAGLGVVVAVTGVAGDFVESLFKRSAGVKDSGAIMPGHGGVLDRFDALFISAPYALLYLILM